MARFINNTIEVNLWITLNNKNLLAASTHPRVGVCERETSKIESNEEEEEGKNKQKQFIYDS